MPPVKLDSRGIEIVKRRTGILVSTESVTVSEFYTWSEASTEQSVPEE
jgi:hypothetical protein